MIDKPVPAKIILVPVDRKATGEEFLSLSTTLYQHNLIFSEPRELRKVKNTLELTVIFSDRKSFKSWIRNAEIVKFWKNKFESQLVKVPETLEEKDAIIEIDEVFNCTCKLSNFYILKGRSLQFADELTCGDCLGKVPYSRIPSNINIEEWQRYHGRFYMNWLESGLFEKPAYKELTNYRKGKLNLESERIRKQLADYFKIPVYINYYEYDLDENHPCLLCGKQGIKSGLKYPNRICKQCNTIFGHGEN